MGWQKDNALATATIQTWHGGRLPVGAGRGAAMETRARPARDADADARESLERLRLTPGALDLDYCTVGDALDELAAIREAQRPTIERPATLWYNGAPLAGVPGPELAALRAAVARLEGELTQADTYIGKMAETFAGVTAERDAARAALDGLIADLEHFAQTTHQAHHGAYAATWRECPRGSCPGLRRAVARARAASDGGGDE